MKRFLIIFLLLSFYVITLGQKDNIENRIQIGVVIQDPSAIPNSSGLTQSTALNALLDSFQIESYFHDYTYYYEIEHGDLVDNGKGHVRISIKPIGD